MPEEQWAQITVLLEGQDSTGQNVKQYAMFERRLADKLSYHDWKVALLEQEPEYLMMHQK